MIVEMKQIKKDELENMAQQIFLSSNDSFSYQYLSQKIADTYLLAFALAKYLKKGTILNLNGPLGSGKTAFMTGIAKYFGMESDVSSPTFTIVNEYNLEKKQKIFHFDVYRIEDSSEFLDCIGTDYFENGICIIEWGNRIKEILPKHTIHIDIKKDEAQENSRIFYIRRENK